MQRTIARDFRILSSLFILITALLIAGIWAAFDFRNLQKNSREISEQLLAEQKKTLQERVQWAVDHTNHKRLQAEERLRETIRARTYEACATAAGLVARYGKEMDPALLRSLVRDSLREIRYNGGRGYFFAINMDGTGELYAAQPHLEGQKLTDIRDSNGQLVVNDMLDLARKSGEGFYRYTWNKPGSSAKDFVKIAFIKHLPELDWVIGTGEYLVDVEADLQQEVLRYLESVRMGPDRQSYFFIGTWDGMSLSFPAKNKNMLDVRDSNGMFVVRELIRKSQQGGGFIHYEMPRLAEVRPEPKLSFVAAIPQWRWYIGTGEYIDYIETKVQAVRAAFYRDLWTNFFFIAGITLAVLVANMLIARRLTTRFASQAERFVAFFRQAAATPVPIDTVALLHEEFRSIGEAANTMLDERDEALAQAREARDRWEMTFNAIQDAILLFDPHGICRQANRTAVTLLADRCPVVIGSHYSTCLCEENLVARTLADLQVYHEQITTLFPGRIFYASCYPLQRQNQCEGIIYILVEITEQKKLEHQLAQSQRLESIGRLAGGVAHDFNNILGAIIGNAELGQLGLDPASPLYDRLDLIKKSGDRASRLTRQLLAFSRKEASNPEIMDLGQEVRELNKMLLRLLGEHIEIHTEVQDGLWPVRMDHGQFEQIMINLAVNARDAMPEGGRITIDLHNGGPDSIVTKQAGEERQEFVILTVSDTGCGMENEVLEHIFEPFYSTKDKSKGTGLGLATVHGIVEQNSGHITVSSRPGQGTRFTVSLPRCESPRGETTLSSEESRPELLERGTETLLLVEDDPELREMLLRFLQGQGYTVLVAVNGQEALQVSESHSGAVDLLLTDMVMPQMGGEELAVQLAPRYPGLRVLYMSGYPDGIKDKLSKDGLRSSFLPKPISLSLLAATLRRLLDNRRQ